MTSYLKREGVYGKLPSGDNFSLTRRQAVRALGFGHNGDLVMGTMMDRVEFLERQCSPLEGEVRKAANVNEDVRLLMTIGGVDFYLGLLISSFIGGVNRFPSDDDLPPRVRPTPYTNEP